MITACIAQAAIDHDEGVAFEDPPRRLVEENFWRAIRHGLDGKLIDLERGEEFPTGGGPRPAAGLDRARPARRSGIEVALPGENGAQRQRRALADGASIEEVFAAELAETQRTYAGVEVRS